ncbi:23S rRNA (guanosine(2251)-2'-O)-methyltransferase RlmB [Desulfurispirillum indicum]|uniref:23S rRNA (guanosine(2251)-2'-O)-methyltransferase RlmB n=1 Tax=Desulfurispirillum indicum TaxID=936456 RepID=UPI001CF9B630|nr:23S rRNA (guanosine(2251)-2'-O)-methyltransferase RlmB [Desulfurispirillum indicum]UCZ55799.1 23S rRNA (guanosine(2251)-2'-O)-methyltransferase RlmB [Desulfurispirillum indicum]
MNIKGVNSVREALRCGSNIEKIFLSRSLPDIETAARERDIPIKILNRDKMDSQFGQHNQGVGAIVGAIATQDPLTFLVDASCIVLADRVQDPGNLGAIIRSAAAFGADVVITEHQSAPISDTVIKASAGNIYHTRVGRVVNAARYVEKAKENGFWTVALDGEGESLFRLKLDGKILLMVGNEGSGLKDILLRHADWRASIPMRPGVESLNASAATAIALYEIARQNHG